MLILPYIRERSMKPKVNNELDFYNNIGVDKISEYQLDKFNQLWQSIQTNVSYYNKLATRNNVPREIRNFEDFKELPIVDRSYVRENIEKFTDDSKQPDSLITTGGSTGTPLKYPSWKTESEHYESSVWYARSFYNIRSSNRMFRVWGHSHTLGSGISKYNKIISLKLGLPLIGYKRFSAYDLSEKQLKRAGEQIIKFKPHYILGYSKALQMLAKANEDRKSDFENLQLKAIIGAAEGFEKQEDKEFIHEIFGCPVGLEYASMETKLLAHTHPDGDYRVLWRNNLVECIDEEGNPSETGRILVTSLYPRAFPLVRYELGDVITGTVKDLNSVYTFQNVKGRDNDFLMLDENTPIH